MGFDANTYKGDFLKENYDRLNLTIPQGDRDRIKKRIAEIEKENNVTFRSLNDFCIEAIYDKAGLPKPEQKPRGRKGKSKSIEKENSD